MKKSSLAILSAIQIQSAQTEGLLFAFAEKGYRINRSGSQETSIPIDALNDEILPRIRSITALVTKLLEEEANDTFKEIS